MLFVVDTWKKHGKHVHRYIWDVCSWVDTWHRGHEIWLYTILSRNLLQHPAPNDFVDIVELEALRLYNSWVKEMLGCPKKLVKASNISNWVITLIYPIYI